MSTPLPTVVLLSVLAALLALVIWVVVQQIRHRRARINRRAMDDAEAGASRARPTPTGGGGPRPRVPR